MKRSGFAKVGEAIMADDRVTIEHVRIYWFMARGVRRGTNQCKIGQRWIGNCVSLSAATVNRRISDLIEWGHVNRLAGVAGMRAEYILTDPCFLLVPKSRPIAPAARKTGRKTTLQQAREWANSRETLDDIFGATA